ncbi:hypothetical protein [uncultured Campylobacter sp.]|uniref:hypothetical protein n=1 Tax=uncultured Campylobacter sp. TaxID=218934 RepID=UPI00262B9BC3|nr:hypothetical protein [uncultured Campylobacter sp.]
MKAVYITIAESGASIIAKVADENKKILDRFEISRKDASGVLEVMRKWNEKYKGEKEASLDI